MKEKRVLCGYCQLKTTVVFKPDSPIVRCPSCSAKLIDPEVLRYLESPELFKMLVGSRRAKDYIEKVAIDTIESMPRSKLLELRRNFKSESALMKFMRHKVGKKLVDATSKKILYTISAYAIGVLASAVIIGDGINLKQFVDNNLSLDELDISHFHVDLDSIEMTDTLASELAHELIDNIDSFTGILWDEAVKTAIEFA